MASFHTGSLESLDCILAIWFLVPILCQTYLPYTFNYHFDPLGLTNKTQTYLIINIAYYQYGIIMGHIINKLPYFTGLTLILQFLPISLSREKTPKSQCYTCEYNFLAFCLFPRLAWSFTNLNTWVLTWQTVVLACDHRTEENGLSAAWVQYRLWQCSYNASRIGLNLVKYMIQYLKGKDRSSQGTFWWPHNWDIQDILTLRSNNTKNVVRFCKHSKLKRKTPINPKESF